jgi:mRNA deadenylase 3'-5' endonuclease subunit Ccr4
MADIRVGGERQWVKRPLSLMSFNVLAEIYEDPAHLGGAGAFSKRCSTVEKRIWEGRCDVVCLCEVNPVSWYRQHFSSEYDIYFAPKRSDGGQLTLEEMCTHVNDNSDGTAIMVRRGACDVLAGHHIRVQQARTDNGDLTDLDPSNPARQFCIALELYHAASQRQFVVATMHMKANGYDGVPGAANDATRVCHALQLMPRLEAICRGRPILFCGDFNAKPQDPTLDFLLMGRAHVNGRNYYRPDGLRLVSGMVEAFGKEPEMTILDSRYNPQTGWWATLDYVMFEKGRWTVTGALSEPTRDPNATPDALPLSGSDHFPIVLELLML